MGRGKGKAKKLPVTNHDDPGSGEEEKIPVQKRRGRPQKTLKDENDIEEEVEKVEELNNVESPSASEKKRKRLKDNPDLVKEENGSETRSSTTDESTKSNNGFRHNGTHRRKSTPRRAAFAGVACN